MESYKSSQVFAIAGENQHGISSGYDINQQVEHGSSNSHTDSANSQVVVGEIGANLIFVVKSCPLQEPLWAYQKSSSEGAFSDTHYPAAALQVQNWTCTPFILILTSLNLEKRQF